MEPENSKHQAWMNYLALRAYTYNLPTPTWPYLEDGETLDPTAREKRLAQHAPTL